MVFSSSGAANGLLNERRVRIQRPPRPENVLAVTGHEQHRDSRVHLLNALRQFRAGDPRRIPSALVALGEAEMAAGNFPRAVELLRRAVPIAHEAALLPWRIADAEHNLREAEAAAADGRPG